MREPLSQRAAASHLCKARNEQLQLQQAVTEFHSYPGGKGKQIPSQTLVLQSIAQNKP